MRGGMKRMVFRCRVRCGADSGREPTRESFSIGEIMKLLHVGY